MIRRNRYYDALCKLLDSYDAREEFLRILGEDPFELMPVEQFFLLKAPTDWMQNAFDWMRHRNTTFEWSELNDEWEEICWVMRNETRKNSYRGVEPQYAIADDEDDDDEDEEYDD